MSITIRSAQTIRNGVTLRGNDNETQITVIIEGLILNLDARNPNSWSRHPGETTWYDLSGNGYHATVYGGVSYGESNGGALNFTGADEQYAQCPPGQYFNITSNGYTIQSWVYVISVPNWNRIIDFGSNAGSDNVLLSATEGLSGLPVLWTAGNTFVVSTVQLQANTGWHHVCATWTPTGNVGKVFIDGVLTGSSPNIAPPIVSTRANCYIGRSNWGYPPSGPDPNFNGGMGAIQIYNRTLSDEEIAQNYSTTKSRYGL